MTATNPYLNVFLTVVATVAMAGYLGQQLTSGLLPPMA